MADVNNQAEAWCRELDSARAQKDYAQADRIRKQIQDAGFEVRTTKSGTTIQRPLA
jgi:cysteinyl-tRNA synthetase